MDTQVSTKEERELAALYLVSNIFNRLGLDTDVCAKRDDDSDLFILFKNPTTLRKFIKYVTTLAKTTKLRSMSCIATILRKNINIMINEETGRADHAILSLPLFYTESLHTLLKKNVKQLVRSRV